MIYIYLDTQDYSKFADIGTPYEAPHVSEVFQYLVQKVRNKEISIAYSATILSELLQYESAGRDLTFRKAEIVEKLCEGNAFESYPELIKNELIKPNLKTTDIISNNDYWLKIENILDYTKDKKRDCIKDKLIELKLNRKHRRKNFKILNNADIPLHKNEDLIDKNELPYIIEKTFILYLNDKISKKDAEAIFISNLLKPTSFAKFCFEKMENGNIFSKIVRDISKQFYASFLIQRTRIESFKIQQDNLEIPNIDDVIKFSLIRAMKSSIIDKKIQLGVISDEEFCNTAFYKTISKLYPSYIIDNCGLFPSSRSPLPSDFTDFLHSAYLPYTDVWRGDIYFSNLLIKSKVNNNTAVCQSLKELPDKISKLLNSPRARLNR